MKQKRKVQLTRELEAIQSLLNYVNINPKTGIVTWKTRTSHRIKIGDEAGSLHQGYRKIGHCDHDILTHRLIFYSVHGYLPENIDHKNQNGLDNNIENLRGATKQENGRNRSPQNNNSSGHTGVCWHKASKKWDASIRLLGRKKYLGVFNDKEDAIKARREAEIKYFGEFAPKQGVIK